MYDQLAELVRRRSGIKLPVENPELIDDKLAPVARLFGFRDLRGLLEEMAHPPEELAQAVTEAMTTRDTSFFRDTTAFDCLEHVILPAVLENRARVKCLRLWCSGVSSGQEAYSVAMILDRFRLIGSGWKIELLATDLSFDAIARARRGTYTNFEVERGLTSNLLSAYFTSEESGWRVADRLRRMVSFRTFNLLDDFGWLGELDVIFCRNVLLYLDPKVRAAALRKLAHALAPDGYLFLGPQDAAIDFGLPLTALPQARGIFAKSGAADRALVRKRA
ncbi:MAG TPA: protein-glutamate O-methyltransferase CheR [Rhizomicrobium sp.]|jgi:chemotaxis protein methyltransferase CheR|nr:protein-glutamate O-methyltransferase CheR [Rhizomicrobium sp.]